MAARPGATSPSRPATNPPLAQRRAPQQPPLSTNHALRCETYCLTRPPSTHGGAVRPSSSASTAGRIEDARAAPPTSRSRPLASRPRASAEKSVENAVPPCLCHPLWRARPDFRLPLERVTRVEVPANRRSTAGNRGNPASALCRSEQVEPVCRSVLEARQRRSSVRSSCGT
jgi:hypothetical protein